MRTHRDYKVGWICALPTELAAAGGMLDEIHNPLYRKRGDENTYTLGHIGVHNVVIGCLPAGVYGNVSAAQVATRMLSSFEEVEFGLMVGVGGGVPGNPEHDIRLGDVVVSEPGEIYGGVIKYDYGKTIQGGRFEHTGSLNKPPKILLTALNDLKAARKREGDEWLSGYLSDMFRKWPRMASEFGSPGPGSDNLYKPDYDHPNGSETCSGCNADQLEQRNARSSPDPSIHFGLIASADQVIKHAKTRDRLRQEYKALCFEMEAAGLMDGFPCLVIRGICDYSDSHKNQKWQPFAAATAAAFAKHLLTKMLGESTEQDKNAVDSGARELSSASQKRKLPSNESDSAVTKRPRPSDVIDPKRHRDLNRELPISLHFPEISSRKHHIYQDDFDTYSWIWSEMKPKESFVEWLASDQVVYWITGHPGSGKSTLVKYVMCHSRTRETLPQSCQASAWSIMWFFFDFRAGKGLANNFEGLLRSLLLQLLRSLPELATTIQSHGIDDLDPDSRLTWNAPKLRSSLLTCLKSCRSNICIFVDGLDEYEGSYLDLIDLFNLVKSNSRGAPNSRIKLCLASRPEPVILQHLEEYPGFKMQDYNRQSIEGYASIRLQPLLKRDNEREIRNLIDGIARLSNGVFLWARFAADDLIEGQSHGESQSELMKRLHRLPADLDAMYARILSRVKIEHRYEASVMLRLVCYADAKLSLECLSILVSLAIGDPDATPDVLGVTNIAEFHRRLRSFTGGLVETFTIYNDYQEAKMLHKTLKTYLERPGWVQEFCAMGRTDPYHGTELWLRVLKRLFDFPDAIREIDTRDFLKNYLGMYAKAFEDQSAESSYTLMKNVITDENIRSLGSSNLDHDRNVTALSFAVCDDLKLFCQDIIEAGADVNAFQGIALLSALSPRISLSIILLLLNHGAQIEDKHIIRALQNSDLPAVQRLLEDRTISSLRLWSSIDQSFIGPLYALSDNWYNPFFKKTLRYLLENGVEINAICGPEGTALHIAATTMSLGRIRCLVAEGADVNADGPRGKPLDSLLNYIYWYQHSIMSEHVRFDTKIIGLLIDNGAISDYIAREEMLRAYEASSDIYSFIKIMKEARDEFLAAHEPVEAAVYDADGSGGDNSRVKLVNSTLP